MSAQVSIKHFLKTTGVFFIGAVLSKVITLLMLPLYTNRIPTGDMGYYDLSLTYITIITSALFLDIWVAIMRYLYDEKENTGKAMVIKSGTVIFICSSVVFLAAGIVVAVTSDIEAIGWITAYGLFQNIAQLFMFCSRGLGNNVAFAVSGVLNTIINVLCNIALIVVFDLGYLSLYIAAICGYIAQIIYLDFATKITKVLRYGKLKKEITYSIFRYSLPLCINSVAFWVLTSLNRVIINNLYGNSMNGIYAVGNKFSFVISLITTCFTYAWQDYSFSRANEVNDGHFYADACSLYIKVIAIGTSVALPVIKLIFPVLVGEAYMASRDTIPLFLINAMIAAVSTFIGNVFYAIKDTKSIFYSMVISAIFNVAVGYALISQFQINGANLAVVLSFALNIIIRSMILNKKIGFKLDLKFAGPVIMVIINSLIFIKCNWLINIVAMIFSVFVGIALFKDQIVAMLRKIKVKKEGYRCD